MCNEKASDFFYEELGVSTLDKAVARYRNREGQMHFLANSMTGIKDAYARPCLLRTLHGRHRYTLI